MKERIMPISKTERMTLLICMWVMSVTAIFIAIVSVIPVGIYIILFVYAWYVLKGKIRRIEGRRLILCFNLLAAISAFYFFWQYLSYAFF